MESLSVLIVEVEVGCLTSREDLWVVKIRNEYFFILLKTK